MSSCDGNWWIIWFKASLSSFFQSTSFLCFRQILIHLIAVICLWRRNGTRFDTFAFLNYKIKKKENEKTVLFFNLLKQDGHHDSWPINIMWTAELMTHIWDWFLFVAWEILMIHIKTEQIIDVLYLRVNLTLLNERDWRKDTRSRSFACVWAGAVMLRSKKICPISQNRRMELRNNRPTKRLTDTPFKRIVTRRSDTHSFAIHIVYLQKL